MLNRAKYLPKSDRYLLVQFHLLRSKVTPVCNIRGKEGGSDRGLLAFVERSLMFMNGGLYNSALKQSDCRKLESLNVMGVNGSLTDWHLPRT